MLILFSWHQDLCVSGRSARTTRVCGHVNKIIYFFYFGGGLVWEIIGEIDLFEKTNSFLHAVPEYDYIEHLLRHFLETIIDK